MENVLLIFAGIIAIVILLVLFIWTVIFDRSLRKMIFTFIGIAIDRNALVDPNQPIEPLRDEPLSHVLERRADALPFEPAGLAQPPSAIPQAQIPPEERGEQAFDTSDNGWPQVLDEETRGQAHAFRNLHLRTEYEKKLADQSEKPAE